MDQRLKEMDNRWGNVFETIYNINWRTGLPIDSFVRDMEIKIERALVKKQITREVFSAATKGISICFGCHMVTPRARGDCLWHTESVPAEKAILDSRKRRDNEIHNGKQRVAIRFPNNHFCIQDNSILQLYWPFGWSLYEVSNVIWNNTYFFIIYNSISCCSARPRRMERSSSF